MITYADAQDLEYRVEVREITWDDSYPSVTPMDWNKGYGMMVYPSDRIRYSQWDAVRTAVEFISGLSGLFKITAMREELGWYCESDNGDLITVEIVRETEV